jgi:hypothetical protein
LLGEHQFRVLGRRHNHHGTGRPRAVRIFPPPAFQDAQEFALPLHGRLAAHSHILSRGSGFAIQSSSLVSRLSRAKEGPLPKGGGLQGVPHDEGSLGIAAGVLVQAFDPRDFAAFLGALEAIGQHELAARVCLAVPAAHPSQSDRCPCPRRKGCQQCPPPAPTARRTARRCRPHLSRLPVSLSLARQDGKSEGKRRGGLPGGPEATPDGAPDISAWIFHARPRCLINTGPGGRGRSGT